MDAENNTKDEAKLNGVEDRMAVVEDQLGYDGAEIAKN